MGRGKKKSLVKSVTLSLMILAILYIISVANFQYFTHVHDQIAEIKQKNNNITLLLNELYMTANETDRLSSLYIKTQNKDILNEYMNLVEVYYGTKIRSNTKYSIYTNVYRSYPGLLTREMEGYNPSYIDEKNGILNTFDVLIQNQLTDMRNSNNDLSIGTSINSIPNIEDNSDEKTSIFTLNNKITDFKYDLKLYQNNEIYNLAKLDAYLHISWYVFNTCIAFYGFYLVFKMYILLIKPIKEGHKLVEQISNGNDQLRLKYPYNNELYDVVRGFNKYLDLSQQSFKLIIDQYNKIKLYSDIGEINYVEYDFSKRKITINYCKKFVERYYLSAYDVSYSFKEYLSMIHKEDLKRLLKELHLHQSDEINNVKFEYRILFPDSEEYTYISTVGQRRKNHFIGIQVDTTDLKVTQKRLTEQEEQYKIIVENTTDLIAKIKLNGDVIYASKSYREIFQGYDNVNDYNQKLKITNKHWIDNLMKPPYTTTETILVDTSLGEKWILWNNDVIFDEDQNIDYIISVGHDITALQQANERLLYDSEHDSLTKLLNRRGLFNEIAKLEHVQNMAAFFIDINNFKNINDFYGHEIGDMIIVKIAEDLMTIKQNDIIISRLSGDEFVIIVPNFTSLNFIQNKIKNVTSKNYKINHNDIFISSSIGYAIYPDDTNDLTKLVSYADIAMYEAKMSQNKNCLHFTKKMYDVVNTKVEMANDLKKAIENDEFEVYFQPIINVQSNQVDYLEALVRWNSAKGLIMPGAFLPIAEESGFMQSLDLLIINKALLNFYDYKLHSINSNTKLSVNVSPIMLLQDDFPLRLSVLVRKIKLNNEDICIEISENTFVNNIEQSKVQIIKLRKLGFLVAIDDFGREYSSLSILGHLEYDLIKIDRLFVKNLEDETNVEVINMITKIAHLKAKKVIAEGVELEEQNQKLIALGCTLMQGYLFSKPQQMKNGILIKQRK